MKKIQAIVEAGSTLRVLPSNDLDHELRLCRLVCGSPGHLAILLRFFNIRMDSEDPQSDLAQRDFVTQNAALDGHPQAMQHTRSMP